MSVLTPEQEEHFGWYAEVSYDDPESGVYVLRLQTIYNFFYLIENLGIPLTEVDVEYTNCLSGWYGHWQADTHCHMVVGMSKVSLYICRPGGDTVYHGGLVADFDFDKFRPLLASVATSE